MRLLTAACGLLVLASTGCTQLPSSGPSTMSVVNSANNPMTLNYALVPVDERVLDVLARRPRDSFSGSFGGRQGGTSERIGVGDVVSVTIWEAANGGLFSSANGTLGGGSKSTEIPEQPVASNAEFMRNHGPHLWIVDNSGRRVASEEMIRRLLMVGDLANDRAHNRQLVGNLRESCKILAEDLSGVRFCHPECPAIFRRSLRFGIPRFLLRHTAGKIQVDYTFRLALLEKPRLHRRPGLVFQEIGETEAKRSAKTGTQGVATTKRKFLETGTTGRLGSTHVRTKERERRRSFSHLVNCFQWRKGWFLSDLPPPH